MNENPAGEYSNLQLHPEWIRHAVTNRPPIHTIKQIDNIITGDAYRIVTIDSIQQNLNIEYNVV
jgi:hypothetical protein